MALDKNINRLPVISKIFYGLISSVDKITLHNNDRFTKNIILLEKETFPEVYFTAVSAVFEEKDKQEDAGLLYEQTLKFNFPGEDPDNSSVIDAIRNRQLMIVFQYEDGAMKFFGSPDNGARFAKSTKIDGKISSSEFSFTCTSQEPAWWLNYIGETDPE